MTNNKQAPKKGKGPSNNKNGGPKPKQGKKEACVNEKKARPPASVRTESQLVKKDAKADNMEKQKLMNSTLLLPLLGKGLSRDSFPYEVSPDLTNLAMIILAVVSYCMSFLPKGLASQADGLIGCFWEDSQRAAKGQRSLFQQAPRVWWEIRDSWTPCTSKSYSFNFDDIGNSVTYSAASSYYLIGNQFTTLFGPGSGAPAFTPYTAAINVSSASYELASDVFAYAGDGLRVGPNPFEKTKNHDPSAFGFQLYGSTNVLGFGACQSNSVPPVDYNRYCKVLPRDRFKAAMSLAVFNGTTAQGPLSYSIMTASASTEIGHRMFCDFIKAPNEVRNYLPVCVRVDINQLILATMNLFQKALIDGGVAAGAITAFGSYDLAAYLFCAICEWFGPWSQVTYPRGFVNSSATLFLNITSGSLIQNMWSTKPIPGALAVNLSHLVPCIDTQLKRVYYPSLDLQQFAFTTYAAATYTVFSANASGGVTPWASLTTTQWAAFFDTTGAMAATLNSYAGFCPMRTLPHTAKVLSLACHVQMKWFESGTGINVVASTHPPSDEERELYTIMILPNFINATNNQFYEYARFFGMRELTVLPNASDPAIYYGFAAKNNNMLSTTAKVYLDRYDQAQEEKSSGYGFIGTIATVGGAVGSGYAYMNRDNIQNMVSNAALGYVMHQANRRV